MKATGKILKNSSWLIGGRIVSDGLSLIFYIALARTFGESGIGDYAFAFSLAALFGLFIEFGFNHLVTREIAIDPPVAPKYLSTVPVIQVGLFISMIGLLYILNIIAGYSNDIFIMILFAFTAFGLKALGAGFTSYLEAIQAMDKTSLLEVLARLISVITGFIALALKADLKIIMLSHVLGYLTFLITAISLVRKDIDSLKFNFDLNFIKKTFVAALPFAGALILYELYARVDIIMLYHFVGEKETGIYAVAVRVITTPLFIATLVGVAVYPVLSISYSKDDDITNQLFYSTLKWLGIIGVLGAVLLITVGDNILIFLFEEKFEKSGLLVRWMSVLLLIAFLKIPYYRYLFSINREDLQIRCQGLSVAVNIILNFFFIPRWGAFGAMSASIISETIMAISFHFICIKYLSVRLGNLYYKLLITGTVGVSIGLLMRLYAPWAIVSAVIVILFVPLVFISRLVTIKEFQKIVLSYK